MHLALKWTDPVNVNDKKYCVLEIDDTNENCKWKKKQHMDISNAAN